MHGVRVGLDTSKQSRRFCPAWRKVMRFKYCSKESTAIQKRKTGCISGDLGAAGLAKLSSAVVSLAELRLRYHVRKHSLHFAAQEF